MKKNNLTKSLRSLRGQSSVEYFVLFAIIASLTILGVAQMFPRMQNTGENYFQSAVAAMGLHF